MTITQVSKKYELSQDTLRYYEKIGLIPVVPRNASGIRDYDEYSCGWVEFIKCMRASGLSIEILVQYVKLFEQGDSSLEARKQLLITQREILMNKVKEIKQTIKRLDDKIEAYESKMIDCENKLKKNK